MAEDRIKENCTVSGTGPITLTGAVASYRSFGAVYSDASIITYIIQNTGDNTWEIGFGVYNAIANTITRTTVKSNSSNNTSLITFVAGLKIVFNDICSKEISVNPGTSRTIPLSRTLPADVRNGSIDPAWLYGVTIHESANFKFETRSSFGGVTHTNSTSTTIINIDTSDYHEVTLTGNSHTIVTTNHSIGQVIIIKVLFGGHTGLTWSDTILWDQSTVPVNSGSSTDWLLVELLCLDEDTYFNPIWTEVSRTTSENTSGGTQTSVIQTLASPIGGNSGDIAFDSYSGDIWRNSASTWTQVTKTLPVYNGFVAMKGPIFIYPTGGTGGGPVYAAAGGVINKNYTTVNATTTSLTDLHTYDVLGSLLARNGLSIKFEFVYTFSADTHNKRLALTFNGVNIYDSGTFAQNGGTFTIIGRITTYNFANVTLDSKVTLFSTYTGINSNVIPTPGGYSSIEFFGGSYSGPVTFKTQGLVGTGGTVSQVLSVIEWEDASN